MKKQLWNKLTAWLCCITMLIGMVPAMAMPVFASATPLTVTGGTLADGNYVLTGDHVLTNTLIIKSGQNVVIDLAGHTISMPSKDAMYFNIQAADAKLTIKDSVGGGKVQFKNTTGSPGVTVAGTFVLEGGELTGWSRINDGVYSAGGTVFLYGGATFNMTGGKLTGADCAFGSAIRATEGNVTINIVGGEITGNNGTYDGSIIRVGKANTVSNVTIGGDAKITGNTLNGAEPPQRGSSQLMTFTNTHLIIKDEAQVGNLYLNGDGYDASSITISGAPTVNFVIWSSSSQTDRTIKNLTSGAKVTMNGVVNTKDDTVKETTEGNLTMYTCKGNVYNVAVGEVQNGTVTVNPESGEIGTPVTVTAKAAEGYELTDIYVDGVVVLAKDGTYVFTISGNHVVTADFAEIVMEETELPTAGGVSSGTYVLTKDFKLSDTLDICGDVVLDLNGQTLSGSVAPYFTIRYGYKLTIMDSAGDGMVQGVEAENAMILVPGGEFVLNSGTLCGHYNYSNNAYRYGGAICASASGSVVTINGGEISGNVGYRGGAIAGADALNAPITININGGAIFGNAATNRAATIYTQKGAVVNLNGGRIEMGVNLSGGQVSGLSGQENIWLRDTDVYISGNPYVEGLFLGGNGSSAGGTGTIYHLDNGAYITSRTKLNVGYGDWVEETYSNNFYIYTWGDPTRLDTITADSFTNNSNLWLGRNSTVGDGIHLTKAGYYYLNLNGYTLSGTAAPYITVGEGVTLYIRDYSGGGKIQGITAQDAMLVADGGHIVLDSGELTGHTNTNSEANGKHWGGAIRIADVATSQVTLNGGVIRDNTAYRGGAVAFTEAGKNYATLTINGTAIEDNAATSGGANLYAQMGANIAMYYGHIGDGMLNGAVANTSGNSVWIRNANVEITGGTIDSMYYLSQNLDTYHMTIGGSAVINGLYRAEGEMVTIRNLSRSAQILWINDNNERAEITDLDMTVAKTVGTVAQGEYAGNQTITYTRADIDELTADDFVDGQILTLSEDGVFADGVVLYDGEYVLDLKGHTLIGGSAPYVTVGQSAKLTIRDSVGGGKVQGVSGSDTAMLYVEAGGELALESGTLTGHRNTSQSYYRNGGAIFNAGTFTMSGGEISGNTAHMGGAIFAGGGANTTVAGGVITGNTATYRGGAISMPEEIYDYYNGNITILGGTISGNKSENVTYTDGLYGFSANVDICGGTIADGCWLRGVKIDITGGVVESLKVSGMNSEPDMVVNISGNPVVRALSNSNTSYPCYINIGELTTGARINVTTNNSGYYPVYALDDTVANSGSAYYYVGDAPPCGDNVYWTLEDGVLTISGTGPMWDYTYSSASPWYDIRSDIHTIIVEDGVTSVGNYAFYNYNNLTKVELGRDVQRIGASAMPVCSNLPELVIPAGVTEIGEEAFRGCSKLVITLEPGNRNYCTKDGVLFTADMTRLMTYPGGLTATSYVIPDSVTTVDVRAFWNAYNLKEVTIPAGVTTLGTSVFYNLQLSRIHLAADNRFFTMVDGALYTADMKRLAAYEAGGNRTALHIPDGVETIDSGALRKAPVASICLPDSVTQISDISYLTNLRSIVLGAGVTFANLYNDDSFTDVYYLGDEAGWETLLQRSSSDSVLQNATVHYVTRDQLCTLTAEEGVALSAHCVPVGETVTVEGSGTAFGETMNTVLVDGKAIEGDRFVVTGNHTVSAVFGPYSDAAELASGTCGAGVRWKLYEDGELLIGGTGAMDNYNYNGMGMAPWYAYREQVTKVTIQSGVTLIGTYAFYSCVDLAEVAIPKTVRTINGNAFYGCPNLTTIAVDEKNTWFCVQDGVLCTKDMTRIVAYPAGRPDTTYTMPDSVTTTWSCAFAYAANLQQITLSSNLQYIYNSTFYNCTGLTEIVIPDSVTSIGGGAFYNCIALTEITIPDSVTTIGASAFNCCYNLATIRLGSGLKTIGEAAFGNNLALTEIVIPAGVTAIGEYVFNYTPALETITVEQGNANYCVVDGVLFTKDMTTLVTYPAGLTATEYIIPNGVTTIFGCAFVRNGDLKQITIPATVTAIGVKAFSLCPLEQVILDESNPAYCLVDGVLYSRDGKTLVLYPQNPGGGDDWSYTVPDGVETDLGGVFAEVNTLYAVCLPDSITTIGAGAFAWTNNLRSIVIGAGVTSVGSQAFNGCKQLKDVYYVGDEAGWNAISINSKDNQYLTNANIHYISRDELRTMTVGDHENGSVALSAHCAPVGAEVTVFAKADAGYALKAILVDGEAIEGNTFTVTGDHEVAVVFGEVETDGYSVTVDSDIANGSVTVDPISGQVGTVVTVTAKPDAGYVLTGIYVDGKAIEGNTFTITGNHVVTATFRAITYNIAVGDVANGSISLNTTDAAVGETIVVSTKANAGYVLKEILVDGVAIKGNSFIVTGDHVVTAEFAKVVQEQSNFGYFSLEVIKTITVNGEQVDICRWKWTPAEA